MFDNQGKLIFLDLTGGIVAPRNSRIDKLKPIINKER